MRSLSLVGCLSLLACGEVEVGRSAPSHALDVGTIADAGAPTVLFDGPPTWTYAASAPLVPGTAETLHYELSRLAQCQGAADAGALWTLSAFLSADGAPATALTVSSSAIDAGATSVDLPFEVPFAKDLAFWFEIQGDGCQAWDSNYGSNFHYTIAAPATPVIHFGPDSLSVQGTPGAGQPLTIDYELARLPGCRATYNTNPAWAVTMFYAFDGATQPYAMLTTDLLGQQIGLPVILTPPAGTQSLALWFENADMDGCLQWDSNDGQNFVFNL